MPGLALEVGERFPKERKPGKKKSCGWSVEVASSQVKKLKTKIKMNFFRGVLGSLGLRVLGIVAKPLAAPINCKKKRRKKTRSPFLSI